MSLVCDHPSNGLVTLSVGRPNDPSGSRIRSTDRSIRSAVSSADRRPCNLLRRPCLDQQAPTKRKALAFATQAVLHWNFNVVECKFEVGHERMTDTSREGSRGAPSMMKRVIPPRAPCSPVRAKPAPQAHSEHPDHGLDPFKT